MCPAGYTLSHHADNLLVDLMCRSVYYSRPGLCTINDNSAVSGHDVEGRDF